MITYFGPPEAWATIISPAAMHSTMLIPKCSFHIVCRPIMALWSSDTSSEYGMFTLNSTLFSKAKCLAKSCISLTRALSSSSRQEPIQINLTFIIVNIKIYFRVIYFHSSDKSTTYLFPDFFIENRSQLVQCPQHKRMIFFWSELRDRHYAYIVIF